MREVLAKWVILLNWRSSAELGWSAKSLKVLLRSLHAEWIGSLLWRTSLKLVWVEAHLWRSTAEELIWGLLVGLELVWHLLLIGLKLILLDFILNLLFQYLLQFG